MTPTMRATLDLLAHAFLTPGEIAAAAHVSRHAVYGALGALRASGRVQAVGRGRDCQYGAPARIYGLRTR